MAGDLIVNGSFEDADLTPWKTSGTVTQTASTTAFDGVEVVRLNPGTGAAAIISQLLLLPDETEFMVISYAIRPVTLSDNSGFQCRIDWLGSGGTSIQEDTLEEIEAGALDVDAWQTRAPQTAERPTGAVWGRLRFLALAGTGTDILLDNVFASGAN